MAKTELVLIIGLCNTVSVKLKCKVFKASVTKNQTITAWFYIFQISHTFLEHRSHLEYSEYRLLHWFIITFPNISVEISHSHLGVMVQEISL